MSDSLKEQLLKLGFKAPARETSAPRTPANGKSRSGNAQAGKQGAGKKPNTSGGKPPRSQEDIDLAKAFAIRAQQEREERLAAERQRQEEARQRREARNAMIELLNRVRRNDAAADIARHFEYGGKIRRIHVTTEQLRALNAGELAVVQLGGAYHLVSAADGQEAERILPGSLALCVDPNSPPEDDAYSDPKYQVPDDLIW